MAETRPLSDVASAFTAALAATTGVTLILSVVHELAYYWIVGLTFLALLDATDYIRQAIYWLPPVAFYLAGVALVYVRGYNAGLKTGLQEGKRAAATMDPAQFEAFIGRGQRSHMWFEVIVFVLCSLAAGLLFLLGGSELLLATTLVLIPPAAIIFNKLLGTDIYFFPISVLIGAIALSATLGIREAHRALRQTVPDFDIRLSDPDSSQRVVVLRLVQRGALIRHPESKLIEFVPSDRLKAILTVRELGPAKPGYEELRDLFGI